VTTTVRLDEKDGSYATVERNTARPGEVWLTIVDTGEVRTKVEFLLTPAAAREFAAALTEATS
jgi:hypothetical protein